MAPKAYIKPLTQRPLDLTYYSFFLIHFICTITIDCLPLWPAQAQTTPGISHVYWFLRNVVDGYTKQTNDPFMLVTWGLHKQPLDFYHLTVFMWMELFIQLPAFVFGMIGLYYNSAAVYPLLLSYASAALVTTITVTYGTIIAPSLNDTTLDPINKFYAMSDAGRWTILGPLIPFLIIPAVLWVDMMFRIGKLVKKGTQVEAKARAAGAGKGKKEL